MTYDESPDETLSEPLTHSSAVHERAQQSDEEDTGGSSTGSGGGEFDLPLQLRSLLQRHNPEMVRVSLKDFFDLLAHADKKLYELFWSILTDMWHDHNQKMEHYHKEIKQKQEDSSLSQGREVFLSSPPSWRGKNKP